MDAKLNTNRRVAPESQRLEAPTGGAARDSVYEAERSGISRLAAAHSKVGEAVASCGKMLYAYDQNRVKEEYAADSRMLNVIYAEEYAALNERFRNRAFDNSQQFKDAYIAESAEVNRRVRERITKGDPAYGGFTFRNIDRWETELSQTADVQAATGMVNATQNWINKREQITMQTNDENLKMIAKIGSAEDANNAIAKMKAENPLYAPYYDAKGATLLQAIKVRDATNSLSGEINALSAESQTVLDGLRVDKMAQDKVELANVVKPGDTPEQVRDKLLAQRKAVRRDTEAEDNRIKAAYFTEMTAKIAAERVEYEKTLIKDGVDVDTIEKLLYRFDRDAQAAVQRTYSAMVASDLKEQEARTKANRQALIEATNSGTNENLLLNGQFVTIYPTDTHLPDIAGTQEFRFQRKLDTNAEGLTPEQKREAMWRNEYTQEQSTRSAAIAINRLCDLNTDDPNYFAKAKDVLEDCRLMGITQEDYAPVYDFFVTQYTKQKPQFQESVGFYKDALFAAIRDNTSILSEDEKETIKNLDDLLMSGKLDSATCDYFLKMCVNAKKFSSYTESMNYMTGSIGKLTKEVDARVMNANVQTQINKLVYRDPSDIFDRNPTSGAFGAEREAQRNNYVEQKRKQEEDERNRQTRVSPNQSPPESVGDVIGNTPTMFY